VAWQATMKEMPASGNRRKRGENSGGDGGIGVRHGKGGWAASAAITWRLAAYGGRGGVAKAAEAISNVAAKKKAK